ncbi:hypothetical protein [Streptomyces violaceus]|uniref:Uncharacterized protein n=1 Tax=Streptomyces violaceus TaxID=1936 RepID=A0ABZ1NLD4_STRVL
MNAEQWNAMYPVGTPVFAYPGCRPEDGADTRLVTRTRSKAEVLGGHTDVVWVDGHSACIALSHVDPVTEEQFEKARAEETAAAVATEGALPVPVDDQPQPLDDAPVPDPIPARWDRTVILPEHPNGDLDGQTIVCCIADDDTKRPIGLFLDDEHREALGLLLVDPNGEDEEHAALLAEVQHLQSRVAELEEQCERRRLRLIALQNDALNMRGLISPSGEARKVPFPLGETLAPAVWWLITRVAELEAAERLARAAEADAKAHAAELEAERHTTNEALSDAAEQLRANRDRIAELEKRSATLAALEAAGVDNWDGYSDALDGDS